MDDEEEAISSRLKVTSTRSTRHVTTSLTSVSSSSYASSFDESLLSSGERSTIRKAESTEETSSTIGSSTTIGGTNLIHAASSSSKSMESLRQHHEHRSFLERGEVRRVTTSRTPQTETIAEIETKRGGGSMFAPATGGRLVPCQLSLTPPTVERKLTILSPGWNTDMKRTRKLQVSLPRLILPTPDQENWMG
ncbi:hypothetical protein O3M35_002187 [Rhynocoris fuscipes]|uniref:Uncharacterized protein n=1 Tax=Rhynocoris fuscipes TaxID=488301 RepID=A0AAW1CQ96_9HEMI